MQKLQQEKARLEQRLGASTSLATLAREARALGYVRPGEHLFIVKGIAGRLAAASSGVACRRMDTDRAIVAKQIGREPRAFRRVAVRCPFGTPGGHRAEPVRPDAATPFPTTYYVTCRHLVAAISRLEAAGGVERWTRAAAGGRRSCRRASTTRTKTARRVRRSSPATRRAATAARRSSSASAASADAGSLKCLHAHVGFALAQPGYELGDRIARRARPRLWPDALLHSS